MAMSNAARQARYRANKRNSGGAILHCTVSAETLDALNSMATERGIALGALIDDLAGIAPPPVNSIEERLAAIETRLAAMDTAAPVAIAPAPVAIEPAPIDEATAVDTAAPVAIENSSAPSVSKPDDFALGEGSVHAPTELERKVLEQLRLGETSNIKIAEFVGCHRNSVVKVKQRIKSGELRI